MANTIIFYGMSGVGRATLLKALTKRGNYYLVPMVTTREPRPDDDPDMVRFVDVNEFMMMKATSQLAYGTYDGFRGYGVLASDIEASESFENILIMGSPYDYTSPIEMGWKNIYVTGDAFLGLLYREGEYNEFVRDRSKINTYLQSEFYNTIEFRNAMSLVFTNDFGRDIEILSDELNFEIEKLFNTSE